MKILNKQEFYKCPEGTLFHKYEPCVFGDLTIKGKTIFDSTGNPIDYFEIYLVGNVKCSGSSEFSDILFKAEENKDSFELDFEDCGRDGLYEENQLYAVYEKMDIDELISTLQKCVGI